MRWRIVESVCKLLRPPKHEKEVDRAAEVTGRRGDEVIGFRSQLLLLLRNRSVGQAVGLAVGLAVGPAVEETKANQRDPRKLLHQQQQTHQVCSLPDQTDLSTLLWAPMLLNHQTETLSTVPAQQQPNKCAATPSPTSISSKDPTDTFQTACDPPHPQATALVALSPMKQTGNPPTPAVAPPPLKASLSTPSITKSPPMHHPQSLNNTCHRNPDLGGAMSRALQTSLTLIFVEVHHTARLLILRLGIEDRERCLAALIVVVRRKTRVII